MLHEHLEGATQLALPEGARGRLGNRAQASGTFLAHVGRNLLRQAGGHRALLRVKGKDTGDRQAGRGHKLQELLELALRLAREAGHERRANGCVRQHSADLRQQVQVRFAVPLAAHGLQHAPGGVLQRQVHVWHGVGRQGLQERCCDALWLQVEQAQPERLQGCQIAQKARQPAVARRAVAGSVLAHEYELAGAALQLGLRQLEDGSRRDRRVAAFDERDGAESAATVAAVRDLEIADQRAPHTLRRRRL